MYARTRQPRIASCTQASFDFASRLRDRGNMVRADIRECVKVKRLVYTWAGADARMLPTASFRFTGQRMDLARLYTRPSEHTASASVHLLRNEAASSLIVFGSASRSKCSLDFTGSQKENIYQRVTKMRC